MNSHSPSLARLFDAAPASPGSCTAYARRFVRFVKLLVGLFVACFVALGACADPAVGQYDPDAPEPIERLRGSLYLHGGGPVTTSVRHEFLELAGGAEARVFIVPADDPDDPLADQELELWRALGVRSVRRLHAFTRDEAERPEFVEPLDDATGVWFCGGRQSRLAGAYVGTPVERALQQVVRRGGAVGGTSAGAAIASRVMIVQGELRTGLDLLPGAVVDQHFLARNREERLRRAIVAHPDRVGLGIDESTALVVRGRSIAVRGLSTVTVLLAASADRPEKLQRLKSGDTADLVALSRAAVARSRPPFPPAAPAPPVVPAGSLVIVGGGRMPKGLLRRFVDLAGGFDAPIVYVPCEEAERLPGEPDFVEALRRAGVKQVSWIHTKDRRKADDDREFLKPLETARGVWFGGGRQWNLVDSYQDTTAHRLMHEVLRRGGVIGGSSAGASIQGDYMPRGDPLGNLVMMAEGYERGLGFLTGVAIDQHFSQRNRFADLSALVRARPQLLGLGIDEATALIVRGELAEVYGEGRVAFYDGRRQQQDADAPDYEQHPAGVIYNLVERRVEDP